MKTRNEGHHYLTPSRKEKKGEHPETRLEIKDRRDLKNIYITNV